MKNITIKIMVGFVAAGAVGFLYWYYEFGGGLGVGQDDGTAIISMSGDDASSSEVVSIPDVSTEKTEKVVKKIPDAKPVSAQNKPDVSKTSAASDTPPPVNLSEKKTTNNTTVAPKPSSEITGDIAAESISEESAASPQVCSFMPGAANLSRRVILNEIAWMGSLPQTGETSAKASNREWIELKNISAAAIDLSGWQILDSGGNLKIMLGNGTSSGGTEVPPGGFYLLVRDGQSLAVGGASVPADAGYVGGLSNAGNELELFDADCGVADFLDASTGWAGGNNTTKQTMERDRDGLGWHASVGAGGTPRAENSVPIVQVASTTSTTTASTSTESISKYLISVSMTGNGVGTVSDSPAGILCGFDCEESYPAGTKLTFTASPEQGSQFAQWSGVCAGAASGTASQCVFTVSSSAMVIADFEKVPPLPAPIIAPSSTTSTDETDPGTDPPPTTPSSTLPSHLLIAAVQIAGSATSNDFVKIFNPTGVAVDLSGWKLRKKSSTGTEYSLKTLTTGSTIAPGSYFMWANSTNGFADSIGADASSTETLSADNSVALLDANSNIVDQVAWGTGTNQFVEGSAYPTNPTANQVLGRNSAAGGIMDSDNNAADFGIQ